MLLPRADAGLGTGEPAVSVEQPAVRRGGLCLAGGQAEPAVPAARLLSALPAGEVETFRPLLPVGYSAGVEAYRHAALSLTERDLTTHYTAGLGWFHGEFIPDLKR